MAHPPAVDSNLTLADFLKQTTTSSKGIKLDFKTIVVVEPSLKMIANMTSGRDVKNPIWLNADILPGPCYDKICVPVDHFRFLSFCKKYFPKATLSISWTTGYNMTPADNYYNWSQVISMGKLVSQISQPITFPIRAVLVKRSWEQIHWLLDLSETFTITIWSSVSDKVDVQDLVRLRGSVLDKRRVFYDLPPSQEKAFKAAFKSPGTKYISNSVNSFGWRAIARKECDDVLVGRNSVMFSGEGGLVISDKILYKITAYYYLFVNGICSFVKTDAPNHKRSVTIQVHVENATGTVTNVGKASSSGDGKFVTLVLDNNGDFQFSINGGDTKQGSVKSDTNMFKFLITESSPDGKRRTFKCWITAQDSKKEEAFVSLETESEPMAGHLLISTGVQSGAVLVQKVQIRLAASETSGGGKGPHYFHTFLSVLWAVAATTLYL